MASSRETNSTPRALVTRQFRNQIQKWAEVKGVPIEDCPPAILADLDNVCPLPGMNYEDLAEAILGAAAKAVGGVANMADLHP